MVLKFCILDCFSNYFEKCIGLKFLFQNRLLLKIAKVYSPYMKFNYVNKSLG